MSSKKQDQEVLLGISQLFEKNEWLKDENASLKALNMAYLQTIEQADNPKKTNDMITLIQKVILKVKTKLSKLLQ